MVVVCMGGVGLAGGVVSGLVGDVVCGGEGWCVSVLAPRRHRHRHNGGRRSSNDVETRLLLVGDRLL